MSWPRDASELIEEQRRLATERPGVWSLPAGGTARIAGCFVCFPRGYVGSGSRGDPAWAAAAVTEAKRVIATALVRGVAGDSYRAGLLALREGPPLERAVRALDVPADVLIVNATGRDHPRAAGLALQLGAVLEMPTVGVTDRPLLAGGSWPDRDGGADSPLLLHGDRVGHWLRTRAGARPVAVHAGWRTDPQVALVVVRAALDGRSRTPAPLRLARRLARQARQDDVESASQA